MKLKHFIYSICLAGLTLSSCQKEEDLEGTVDLSSPYVLEDSDDPIDHRRYELYRDYGVAIFFILENPPCLFLYFKDLTSVLYNIIH